MLLDGLPGALFAFGQRGRVAVSHEDYWETEWLLDEARSEIGSDLDPALADARRHDPYIDAYLRAVEADAAFSADKSQRPAEHQKAREATGELSWREAQRQIGAEVRGTGKLGMRWSQWGRVAPEAELKAAAHALVELPRDDLDMLRPYLCLFRLRTFPLNPQPIIELLNDPRDKVAWFAANLLARTTHPAVRAEALRMAEIGPLRERAVDLLATTWQPGDDLVVERLLGETQDADKVHTIGFGLRDVIERQLTHSLVPALVLGYYRTPCSECRGAFVDALLQLDALSDELRTECRWDARRETRDLVAPTT